MSSTGLLGWPLTVAGPLYRLEHLANIDPGLCVGLLRIGGATRVLAAAAAGPGGQDAAGGARLGERHHGRERGHGARRA